MFLSIIIPAYNEAENFRSGCLDEVDKYLKKQKYAWEVILVDDQSNDGSGLHLAQFAKNHKDWKYLRISHGGKAAAVYKGILTSRGKIILFIDFDQSTPIASLDRVLTEIKAEADIVIGDRKLDWERPRSYIFNLLTRLITGLDFSDTQCGFKAFKRPIALALFAQLKVHKVRRINKPYMGSFDVELLYLARKHGFRIKSIPVIRKEKKSGRHRLIEPFEMLFCLLKIKVFDWLGYYKSNANK